MRALIDTPVWLDVVLGSGDAREASLATLYACIDNETPIVVTAVSLAESLAAIASEKGDEDARSAAERMLALADVLTVDDIVCRKALESELRDYRAALSVAAAQADSVDLVITRNDALLGNKETTAKTPEEFLADLGYELVDLSDL
ncbi:PIN domain-containing protein [uncultured Adlercreutzia sp.]|uniref:PIN domain-containing protein n=1 Tax=uncultured Adlercreutzia sp. TaxID=875803 RepID=UPI0026F38AC5|nr:PIN domain-containing protein [uncultured Adlercreutzia sp.]